MRRWAGVVLTSCATTPLVQTGDVDVDVCRDGTGTGCAFAGVQGPVDDRPSTFQVRTVSDLVGAGRGLAPGGRFTVCRDERCMLDAQADHRPFVAELADGGRFVGTVDGELQPLALPT